MDIQLSPELLALVPVIALLLQMMKRIEMVAKVKDWLPFVSIVASYGLILATGIEVTGNPILTSITIGMLASGGYDLVRGPTKSSSVPAPSVPSSG